MKNFIIPYLQKIISLLLIIALLSTIIPLGNIQLKAFNNNLMQNNSVELVEDIINSDFITKCIDSERYVYWNFYISTDTSWLTAYGYRYADALYNLDIIKAVTPTVVSKKEAKEVIEEYIVEFTKRKRLDYENLLKVDGLLNLINNGIDAYSDLVEINAWNNKINENDIEKIIYELSPWKEKLEACIQRGGVDEETKAWILGDELPKITATLHKADVYDKLIFSSTWISNGLKVMTNLQELYDRIDELMILKYASNDMIELLELLIETSINDNIKKAAVEVKRNLSRYKDANIVELISLAVGDRIVDKAPDWIISKLTKISIKTLQKNGIKLCMVAEPILKAIEAGVHISNFLFNTGDTLEQANKMRVMSLISLCLVSKVVEEQRAYIIESKNENDKVLHAEELLKYLYMLLVSRELGELQYYNMRQEAEKGALTSILKFFNKNNDVEEWFQETMIEINNLISKLGMESSNYLILTDEQINSIEEYLRMYGDCPLFTDASKVDPVWIISKFFSHSHKNPINTSERDVIYEKYKLDNFISIKQIESIAKKKFNLNITLKSVTNKQKVNIERLSWIKEYKVFGWAGGGNPQINYMHIDKIIIKNDKIIAEGIFLKTFMAEWNDSTVINNVYDENKLVGIVEYDLYNDVFDEFRFTSNFSRYQYTLQQNGESYYLLSKQKIKK